MELYIEIEMETTDSRRSIERIRAYSCKKEKLKKCRKGGGQA